MRIGVTGGSGLIGWHLRALLRTKGRHEVTVATRDTFANERRLNTFVSDCDAIVHLAGMNRGEDSEVELTNKRLAMTLIAALERTGSIPRIVYSNTIQFDKSNAYGRGKQYAAAQLRAWASRVGGIFVNLICPHTFGEFGKPFHNSVVSTFCHQLAHGEAPKILVDGEVELIHAQDVAAACLGALEEARNDDLRLHGVPMKVSDLLDRLQCMLTTYRSQIVPDTSDRLDMQLFNTLRSYLYPGNYPVFLRIHMDSRGGLYEAVKGRSEGQAFISTTHPGITRGNHFHTRKVERFLVMSGEAEIRLRKLFADEVKVFPVSGKAPCYIDMPTFHTHSITNVGASELVTLFWSNEIFDVTDSDTYAEPVMQQ